MRKMKQKKREKKKRIENSLFYRLFGVQKGKERDQDRREKDFKTKWRERRRTNRVRHIVSP